MLVVVTDYSIATYEQGAQWRVAGPGDAAPARVERRRGSAADPVSLDDILQAIKNLKVPDSELACGMEDVHTVRILARLQCGMSKSCSWPWI